MKPSIASYVMDHNVPRLRAGDLKKLDILYYSFAKVDEGKVVVDRLRNVELISEVRKINPHLRVMLSIGGWGAGGFSEAAFTAEGRALFTETAMEIIRKYDFDGIDMDWEYPCSSAGGIASHPDDKQNFTYLMESLRAALDAYGNEKDRNMHLSTAVGAGKKCADDMEMEKLAPIVDQINLMTYDMGGFGGKTGHHTNLYKQKGEERGSSGDNTVKIYSEAGIPMEKLVLGAAFYGRGSVGTKGLGEACESATVYNFTEIDIKLSTGKFTRHWDEAALAPYAYDGNELISYDDEESLKEKCRYVAEKGLGGIMFWEYGGDRTAKLLDTLTDPANWQGKR